MGAMDGWAPGGPRQGTAGRPVAFRHCLAENAARGDALPRARVSTPRHCQGPGFPRQASPRIWMLSAKPSQGPGRPQGLGKAVPRARRPSVRPARLPTRSLPRTGRPRAWPRQSRPATTRPPAMRPRHVTAAPRENWAEGPSAADSAGPATRHPDRRRNAATAPTAPGEVSPDPTPSHGTGILGPVAGTPARRAKRRKITAAISKRFCARKRVGFGPKPKTKKQKRGFREKVSNHSKGSPS